jgi:hypothetical protein
MFSRHLKFEDFEQIVEAVLSERGVNNQDIMVAFNPELAPTELVFQQAMTIEHFLRRQSGSKTKPVCASSKSCSFGT